MNMKYYKVINPLSQLPNNALCFDEAINVDAFEMSKINYDPDFFFDGMMQFSIDTEYKYNQYEELDFNLSNSGIQIVSETFKNILPHDDVTFFNIETINYETKKKYYALKINNFCDCVDETKSDITYWTNENTKTKERIGKYKNLLNFVIDDKKVCDSQIFRLEKHFPAIIIREDLKEKIIENKITGIDFVDTCE